MNRETIVAAASAQGQSAVAVLRLSGAGAAAVLARCVHLEEREIRARPRELRLARFLDEDGSVLDQVLVAFMPGPRSYTGEDLAEVHAHGGRAVVSALLERMLKQGARPALAGEFTRRALENGKLDLSRAEAVARMIEAGSRAELKGAARALQGDLSRALAGLEEGLEILLAQLEASLNFPEEPDLESLELKARALDPLLGQARRLAEGLRRRADGDGLEVVLAGAPNVGKSSIINSLSGKKVALVTPQAGTTRDAVGVDLELAGRRLRLVDTAGRSARAPEGEADRAAEALAAQRAAGADLILWVDDRCLTAQELDELPLPDKGPWLLLRNKADLLQPAQRELLVSALEERGAILVSARSGEGMDGLLLRLEQTLAKLLGPADGIPLSSRQSMAMDGLLNHLAAASHRLEAQPELAAEDLRQAFDALGELTGRRVAPDLLDRIFSSFCIGK